MASVETEAGPDGLACVLGGSNHTAELYIRMPKSVEHPKSYD